MFLNRPGANAAQRVDGAVAEIGLQGSGINDLIGQRVAAGMPEHVGWTLKPILASSPARASSLAKPDGVNDHNAPRRRRRARLTGASAPACWFNRRCRGGEHTAQEVLSCNRSLEND
jgi:hypothetical protein